MNFSEQLDQFVERGAEVENRDFCYNAYLRGTSSLKPIVLKLVEALNFYAADWGPHHGNDERTNLIIMETLNRAGFKARETLAEVEKLIGEDNYS